MNSFFHRHIYHISTKHKSLYALGGSILVHPLITQNADEDDTSSSNRRTVRFTGFEDTRSPQRRQANLIANISEEQRQRWNIRHTITSLTDEQRERINFRHTVAGLTDERRQQHNYRTSSDGWSDSTRQRRHSTFKKISQNWNFDNPCPCLLYTSDAADE